MQKEHRSPTFLVELMLVILFFCISCTAILQLFAVTARQSRRAAMLDEARLTAENLSDTLYSSADAKTCLEDAGFSFIDNTWQKLEDSGLLTRVSLQDEQTEAGHLRHASISITDNGDELVVLPCDRYFSGEAAQ